MSAIPRAAAPFVKTAISSTRTAIPRALSPRATAMQHAATPAILAAAKAATAAVSCAKAEAVFHRGFSSQASKTSSAAEKLFRPGPLGRVTIGPKSHGSTIVSPDDEETIDFTGHIASQAVGYNDPLFLHLRSTIETQYPWATCQNDANHLYENPLVTQAVKAFSDFWLPEGYEARHSIGSGSMGVGTMVGAMQSHQVLKNYDQGINVKVKQVEIEKICAKYKIAFKDLSEVLVEGQVINPEGFVNPRYQGSAERLERLFTTSFASHYAKPLAKEFAAYLGELGTIKGMTVLGFEGGFHGRDGTTRNFMDTELNKNLHFVSGELAVPLIPYPNNLKEEQQSLDRLRTLLEEDKDHHEIAGLVVEPIQGEGGDRHFRPEFLQNVERLLHKYDKLLCADEVQMGMGATGKRWSWETMGIRPDGFVTGKKSSVSLLVIKPDSFGHPEHCFNLPGRLGSTWAGSTNDWLNLHAFTMYAESENLLERAEEVGRILLQHITALELMFPSLICDPRGSGTICAFTCNSQKARDKLVARAREEGAMGIGSGTLHVRLRPPVTIKKSEIRRGFKAIVRALDEQPKMSLDEALKLAVKS